MPTRLCLVSSCGNPASYRGRCPDHARQVNRDTHPNRHVYNSAKWKHTRRAVLLEQPLCACGCGRLSEDVDHIVPIEQGGDVWKRSNLQALTHGHHSAKTRQEQAIPDE